jgi:hypothetical protein
LPPDLYGGINNIINNAIGDYGFEEEMKGRTGDITGLFGM